MTRYYKYETEFRTIGMMCVSVIIFGFLYLSFHYQAPRLFLLFIGFISAVFTYNLLTNPVSGIDLQSSYLRVYAGRWEQRVNLRDVDHLEIYRSSEGDDRFTLHLKNGKKRFLPANCVGKTDKFAQAARDMGITIILD